MGGVGCRIMAVCCWEQRASWQSLFKQLPQLQGLSSAGQTWHAGDVSESTTAALAMSSWSTAYMQRPDAQLSGFLMHCLLPPEHAQCACQASIACNKCPNAAPASKPEH